MASTRPASSVFATPRALTESRAQNPGMSLEKQTLNQPWCLQGSGADLASGARVLFLTTWHM